MIRITQSYLINTTAARLKNEGWEVLYKDLPGGKRSGVGLTAAINKLWEGIYNLSPDLVAVKNNELFLIEVDSNLNKEYLEKFLKYKSKQDILIKGFESILGYSIKELNFGFVAKSVNVPKSIPFELCPFIYMYYDKTKFSLTEKLYNP